MADNNNPVVGYDYDKVEAWCHQVVAQGHEMLFDPPCYWKEMHIAAAKFNIPLESLQSFLRNIHLIHVKKNAHRVKQKIQQHLYDYQEKEMSMVALAQRINFPPYLFARYMVEAMTTTTTTSLKSNHSTNAEQPQPQSSKFNLADAMRYPESKLIRDVIAPSYLFSERNFHPPPPSPLSEQVNSNGQTTRATPSNTPIPTTRLAMEVRRAMEHDPVYGPLSDKQRHLVGVEFEVVLEQELHELGIPFETEAQLRLRGAARTPDVLLSIPVGVQVPIMNNNNKADSGERSSLEWKMVCWIDSKALYGDVNTHHTSVLPQLETYVHRFGPGLVIYWFGHAPLERLGDAQGDVVIVGWDLPEEFLLPDGTVISASNNKAADGTSMPTTSTTATTTTLSTDESTATFTGADIPIDGVAVLDVKNRQGDGKSNT